MNTYKLIKENPRTGEIFSKRTIYKANDNEAMNLIRRLHEAQSLERSNRAKHGHIEDRPDYYIAAGTSFGSGNNLILEAIAIYGKGNVRKVYLNNELQRVDIYNGIDYDSFYSAEELSAYIREDTTT